MCKNPRKSKRLLQKKKRSKTRIKMMMKNNYQKKNKINQKSMKKINQKRKITKSPCPKSLIKSRHLKPHPKPPLKRSKLNPKHQLQRKSKSQRQKLPHRKARSGTSKTKTIRRSISCQGNYELMQTKVPDTRRVGRSEGILYKSLRAESQIRNG